jgi:hypothetical protein
MYQSGDCKRDFSLTNKWITITVHRKKRLATFPYSAGMSPTKLFLEGNNLVIPAQGEFGK